MENGTMTKTLAGVMMAGVMLAGTALPAAAGTGPRTDVHAGGVGLGFSRGAFAVDLGVTPNLVVGIDSRDPSAGTAWGGLGARATFRLLGNADGLNLGIGGRLSLPSADLGALADSKVKDVHSEFQNVGAASAYLLLSVPITSWFILRYPIGMTYYVGANQNGGQAWTFGSASWSPQDSRTMSFSNGEQNVYLPVLQMLPEAAFKLGGFEATLFGTSIAGVRMTF